LTKGEMAAKFYAQGNNYEVTDVGYEPKGDLSFSYKSGLTS